LLEKVIWWMEDVVLCISFNLRVYSVVLFVVDAQESGRRLCGNEVHGNCITMPRRKTRMVGVSWNGTKVQFIV